MRKRLRKKRKPTGQKLKSNVIEFPLDIPSGLKVTPMQLLGIILKVKLKERITDEEVDTICSVYYKTVKDWWGNESNS